MSKGEIRHVHKRDRRYEATFRVLTCAREDLTRVEFLDEHSSFLRNVIEVCSIPHIKPYPSRDVLPNDPLHAEAGVYLFKEGCEDVTYRFYQNGKRQDIVFYGSSTLLRKLHEAVTDYSAQLAGER